jgi:hypothetical protein
MATRLDHPLARSTGTRGTSSPVTTLPPQPQSPRAPVGRVWSLGGLGLSSGLELKGKETSAAEVSRRGSSAYLGAYKRDFREMPRHASSVWELKLSKDPYRLRSPSARLLTRRSKPNLVSMLQHLGPSHHRHLTLRLHPIPPYLITPTFLCNSRGKAHLPSHRGS